MIEFKLKNLIKSLQEEKDAKGIKETKGMKYIDTIITSKPLDLENVDFKKFKNDDLDEYIKKMIIIDQINETANEIYKESKTIKPKILYKTSFI